MRNIKWLITKDGLPFTFVVFYIVGVILFTLPITHDLFIFITPYTLVLTAFAVFFYHSKWNAKTVLVLLSVFILSILAEIIGVATGKLFGIYSYGPGLGFKVFHVPVLIGLNWCILVYGSHAILSKTTRNKYLVILGASLLMVGYDFVMEIAAPLMKMWEFVPIRPPADNYIMWFILALFFNLLFVIFKIKTDNKPARALFIIQIVFFLFIVISNSI